MRAGVECRPAAGRRICERCHLRKGKCSLAGTITAAPTSKVDVGNFMQAMSTHAAVLERHSVMLERYLAHEEAKGLQVSQEDKASTSGEASTVDDGFDDDDDEPTTGGGGLYDEEEEEGEEIKVVGGLGKGSGDEEEEEEEEEEGEEEAPSTSKGKGVALGERRGATSASRLTRSRSVRFPPPPPK